MLQVYSLKPPRPNSCPLTPFSPKPPHYTPPRRSAALRAGYHPLKPRDTVVDYPAMIAESTVIFKQPIQSEVHTVTSATNVEIRPFWLQDPKPWQTAQAAKTTD